MAQCTRWGIAASLAAVFLAGCGGGDKNPISDGQSLTARIELKQAPIAGYVMPELGRSSREVAPFPRREARSTPYQTPAHMAETTGLVAGLRDGAVLGALGTFRLEVDDALNAQVVWPRTGQTQGDKYLLGIDTFFRPSDIRVRSVVRQPGTDHLDVTIEFSHPFPRPADLIPPATSTKRVDLHVFNVWAGLLANGSDSFFGGTVTTNTDVLQNADSYRRTGGLIAAPGGSANVFPGKWVADQSAGNVDPASDNYNPASNGWVGTALQDPRGFGVFPQGASVPITFTLDVGSGNVGLDFAVIADYQDPRATPVPRNNRLPDPLDATKVRYILPYGAGDLQKVSTNVPNALSGTNLETVSVSIVDLDADAPIAANFPDNTNLSAIPFPSGIDAINTSFPTGITASTPAEGTGSGSGLVSSPKIYEFTISNTGAVADGDYVGMVQIVDEENDNLSNEAYVQLDPNLQPLSSTLPIEVYQTVRFSVGAPTGPSAVNIIFEGDVAATPKSYAVTGGFGTAQFGPGATQHPFFDERMTDLGIEQITGQPFFAAHGRWLVANGWSFPAPERWGTGFMIPTVVGMTINLNNVQLLNNAAAAQPLSPRPDRNRTFSIADAYIDPAASSASADASVWAPYPAAYPSAPSHQSGFMGLTDQINLQNFPTNPTLEGRAVTWFIYDSGLFLGNFTTWAGHYAGVMGGIPGYFSEVFGTGPTPDPEPFPGHTPGTHVSFNIDVPVYHGTRTGGANNRDLVTNDLTVFVAGRGTKVATFDALPTDTQFWQANSFFDFNDPMTTFVELWGEFVNGVSVNSDKTAGATLGTGPGSLNPNSTTGMAYSRTGNRLYVVDSTDDTLEVYTDMLPNGSADAGPFPRWNYGGATAAGILTDPQDVTVTSDNFLVVLDKGGPSGTDRLVVLNENTLEVLGTRDIANPTDGEVGAGSVSIVADDSLLNVNDPSGFALLWDDPGNTSTIGAFGGLYWYTIEPAP